MNCSKRSFFYLIRKRKKTINLFLLLVVISSFLLTTFTILQSTDTVSWYMRNTVGAAFHMRMQPNMSSSSEMITEGSLDEQTIKTIMKHKEIKYYNANNYGYTKSDSLKFIPGMDDNEENNMGEVSALHNSSLDSSFVDKELGLVEGRHITKDDKNKIIISEELAKENNITIGDTLNFTQADLELDGMYFKDGIKEKTKFVDAEVVGIYKVLIPQANAALQPTAGLLINRIYTDHNFLIDLDLAKVREYTSGASFYIKDPLALNDIVENVKEIDTIDWDNIFIVKDDFNYEKMASGLQTIEDLVFVLLIVVSVVSFAFLVLILTLRIRSRIHEVGILLSIGKSKTDIVLQFIIEVIIVLLIAFIFSIGITYILTGILENYIFADININQIKDQVMETGVLKENIKYVSMTINTTLLMGFVQLVAIIITVIVSSISIIRLNPREIFSKMS
ncbi:MAG: FtsX-like permease family protein [Coprobacillaceae bacterium]